MKLLTVVIPNYNGRILLEKYLPYLYQSLNIANIKYEIIVADDCSKDESVLFLQTNYPDIILIQSHQNVGFSQNCNKAIKKAQGKYLFLLNSDIQLTANYIKTCLANFKDENTFAVMGQIIDDSKSPQTTGILFKQNYFSIKKQPNLENNLTHFVSGANSIFSTSKLKELNGFNPIFSPYYFEDDDLSYRAMLKGWKSYFVKEAICYHQSSSTIKSCAKKVKIKQVYFRNKMIFNRLHCKYSEILFNINNILFNIIPKYCIGHFWIWNSYKDAVKKINIRSLKNH